LLKEDDFNSLEMKLGAIIFISKYLIFLVSNGFTKSSRKNFGGESKKLRRGERK
jgi:hypothetical protein